LKHIAERGRWKSGKNEGTVHRYGEKGDGTVARTEECKKGVGSTELGRREMEVWEEEKWK
jgi:hypothetical protein